MYIIYVHDLELIYIYIYNYVYIITKYIHIYIYTRQYMGLCEDSTTPLMPILLGTWR